MDERKKTIEDLEVRRHEGCDTLEALCQDLGNRILARGANPDDGAENADALVEYRRLKAEIEETAAKVEEVEANVERLCQIEVLVQEQKRSRTEKRNEFSALAARLGKIVLSDPELIKESASRKMYTALQAKVLASQTRLDEITGREGGNVLSWIGKGVEGLGKRVELARDMAALEKLYKTAGEEFTTSPNRPGLRDAVSASSEATDALTEALAAKAAGDELDASLAELEKERQALCATWWDDGSASRKIDNLRRLSAAKAAECDKICRQSGERAAAAKEEGALEPEERSIVARIHETEFLIADTANQIEKLKASLLIDEERALIARHEKRIQDLTLRIAESEQAIAGLEAQIAASNQRIQELMEV